MFDPLDYCSLTMRGLTIRLLPRSAYCTRYTPDQPVIGFAFESQQGLHAFASDRVQPFYAAANGLAFTPAGCSIYSEAPIGGEYLTLSGEDELLSALLPKEGETLPAERFTGRVHATGVHAAYHLRRLCFAQSDNAAEIETAVADLLGAIQNCAQASWRSLPLARSMTGRRMRIVEDLIEARLGEALSVSDMAAACGLSTGFFLRAFKAATGQTPHRFLMNRRVACAKRMLLENKFSASEIAYLSGFSAQSHMTTAFRRVLGIVPSKLGGRERSI